MPKTSEAMSQLAAKVLSGSYWPTQAEVRRLAACVLRQDETPKPKKAKKGKPQ